MGSYVDDGWYTHNQRATVTIVEEAESAKVTYRNDAGKTFRVMVHQKPNPIGFTAKLPGGNRK